MSIRRLLGTTAAMAAAAVGLRAVTPDLAAGALGLTLTALSALPGVAGALARALTRCVLPAGARRAAALALGVGLVTGGPLLAGCSTAPGPLLETVAVASAQGPVADWPDATPDPDPDRPASAPADPSPVP